MTTAERIENFGGNVAFQPRHCYAPANEAELLAILDRHRGAAFRAMGSKHSWSPAIATEGVLLDLRHLNQVAVERRGERWWATLGAGCQIKHALAELARQADATLPALGLITEQTVAGATATATHGSGRHCLSHYLEEIRLAHFDPATGAATIRTLAGGDELAAARCSLGCLGIVVSVGLWARPRYRIEEHAARYDTIEEVLAQEAEFPLQQFFLFPWMWSFIGQHRRETEAPRSWHAWLYRLYFFCGLDVGMHVALVTLVRWLGSPWGVRWFFAGLLPWLIVRGWWVVDDASDMLIMEHELFQHIETELFVPRSELPAAVAFVREAIEVFAGDGAAVSAANRARLQAAGQLADLERQAGSYTHHYPICIRRIVPDDTLLAMSSGGREDWYAISLISLAAPHDRAGFFAFAEFVARAAARLFGARCHWGKHVPLDAATIAAQYPRLAEFRAIAARLDPAGQFRNTWASRLLGFEADDGPAP